MSDNALDLHEGYIMLFRKMRYWGWYKDANTFKLFVHMLLIANHKTCEWKGQTVERGCFISSTSNLAADAGLSVQETKTAIKHLISTHEIEKRATTKYTYFKVINYDTYQGTVDSLTNKVTSKPTNKQPATNQAPTTNNNDNNERMTIGTYKNVFLSKDEIAHLQESFPTIDLIKCIESFSLFRKDHPQYYSNESKHFEYIEKLITTGKYSFQKVKEHDL